MGTQTVPFLDKVKAVQETSWQHETWAAAQRKSLHAELKNIPNEKRSDAFNFIKTDPKNWKNMEKVYAMSPEEMKSVQGVYDQLRKVDSEQHLGLFNFFQQDLPRLIANDYDVDTTWAERDPKKMSTMQRAVNSGRLDPRDIDLGRFSNAVLGIAREKALEKPMQELHQVV